MNINLNIFASGSQNSEKAYHLLVSVRADLRVHRRCKMAVEEDNCMGEEDKFDIPVA